MHSAEHLLNQTIIRMFDTERSFNAHIEEKKSKCDYYFDRDMTEEEVLQLDKIIQTIIEQYLPVTETFVPREEAMQLISTREKIPEDAGNTIRIVSIGDYDHCPCIGPHVSSTKEIGTFTIISHGYKNGVLRIQYKTTSS